LLYGLVV